MTNVNRGDTTFDGRFPGRVTLDLELLFELHLAPLGATRADALQLLKMIELEFGIPGGILRPEDDMRLILDPVPNKGVVRRIENTMKAGDAKAELNYRLRQRLEGFQTISLWREIATFGDLVRAWCGLRPNS